VVVTHSSLPGSAASKASHPLLAQPKDEGEFWTSHRQDMADREHVDGVQPTGRRINWPLVSAVVAAIVIVGSIATVRGCLAAEPDKPFRYQIHDEATGKPWVSPKGKAALPVSSPTACDLDMSSAANVAVKATRLSCRRVSN